MVFIQISEAPKVFNFSAGKLKKMLSSWLLQQAGDSGNIFIDGFTRRFF
jgi:hypothetical protein